MPAKCKNDNCTSRPSFNFQGEKQGVYCKQHVLDGMVDIRSIRCKEDGCDIQPAFNFMKVKKLYIFLNMPHPI